jgi:septum formation protein
MTAVSTRTIILASSSPRRQELLRSLHLPMLIYPSDVDETVEANLSPVQIVEQLSVRKASAVREQLLHKDNNEWSDGIVLGSDTIVVWNGQVLGKPDDQHHAKEMLSLLQGTVHHVYSGIALIDMRTGETMIGHRCTTVRMKTLTEEQLVRYIASGEPMDKAGAYAIQGLGATLVESIEGCYFNVVGLPVSLLSDMLKDLGINIV